MSTFRFVHAADLHLDTPFAGIGRTSPRVAEALRDASLDAWDRLVDATIARHAAFLLLAGDLYDGPERGVRAQLRFVRGLDRLSERGIQVFIVHGNHDPADSWSAIRHWPVGVTVFGAGRVEQVPVVRGGERLATVHGISHGQRDTIDNLALGFHRGDAPGLHVGLLHCNVGAATGHEPYCPCSLDDLTRAGLDYWALGHVHRPEVLSPSRPAVVYAGSLQARSLRTGEEGAHGAYVVEADPEGIRSIDFVGLDCVRLLTCRVDIGTVDDVAGLARVLGESIARLRTEHAGPRLLVRAIVDGRGDLHRDLQRSDLLPDVLKQLRQDLEGLEPFCWLDRLDDRSRGAIDLDAIRQRRDFSAELLRIRDDLARDADRLASEVAMRAQPFRRACQPRLPEGFDPIAGLDLEVLLGDAMFQALDVLERD
jgi:DNA repair exonuclease SbcCD nuclease subunit